MQISVAPNSTASCDPRLEVVLADVVGVGRALALAEAAKRAADHADVGEVDVAVDDERRGVAGELGAQLVGGRRASSSITSGRRLGEQRGQLVLAQRAPRRGRARSRAGASSGSIVTLARAGRTLAAG